MKNLQSILANMTIVAVLILSPLHSFASETKAEKQTTSDEEQIDTDKLLAKLEGHMQLMHEQMDAIEQTKNKVKRMQLMREHEAAMHESMEIMNLLGGNRMLREGREPAYRMTIEEQLDYMWKLMNQMMRYLAVKKSELSSH